MRNLATAGICLCIAGSCAAQQAPAGQATQVAAGSQADAQAGAAGSGAQGSRPASPPEVPPVPKPLPEQQWLFEPGYADWGLGGNQSKFRQYATPPHGFYLQDLRFDPIIRPNREDLFLDFKGIGQDDYRGDGRLSFNYGRTYFRGSFSQNRFEDPTTAVQQPSAWRTYDLIGRQNATRDFAFSLNVHQDQQNINYAPPGPTSGTPAPNLYQSSTFTDLTGAGKLGGRGYGSLSLDNLHYADPSGTFPSFTAQAVRADYLYTPAQSVDVEGALSRTWIGEQNALSSTIDLASLASDIFIGSATDLRLSFDREHLSLPVVQNAWVRDEQTGNIQLYHHFYGWRAELGVQERDAQRINGNQTFVEVPRWTTITARVTGKPYRHLRLDVRGSSQNLSNSPMMITSDPLSLYWNIMDNATARLEANWSSVNAYAVYTYLHNRNTGRATEVNGELYTLGTVWQVTPTVSLFGEYADEIWFGTTSGLNVLPSLGNFLPDSRIGTVELNWNVRRRVQLSLNYTDFASFNDNPLLLPNGNTHGKYLTINGNYDFPSGDRVGFVVAPWNYTDDVTPLMDYNVAVVMVTGTARF